MTLKISHKVFLAIVITTFFSLITVQIIQRVTFEKGLLKIARAKHIERTKPLVNKLVELYEQNQSWESLKGKKQWPSIILNTLQKPRPDFRPKNRASRKKRDMNKPHFFPFDDIYLVDINQNIIVGKHTNDENKAKEIEIPLYSKGNLIGYLMFPKFSQLSDDIDKNFSNQQISIAIYGLLIALVIAGFLAWLFTRSIVKPITTLREKAKQLIEGDYKNSLMQFRNDEIGGLAKVFNKLASTLNEDRNKRKIWMSDISHELRTPISILKGELECIEDGHKPLNLDSIASLKSEVLRINMLINDLQQLAQTDYGELTFNFENIDIVNEIEMTTLGFNERFEDKNLTIDLQFNERPQIKGDKFRLIQVISNLLENSIRYTNHNGKIVVSGAILEKGILITFEDSSPGVPLEALTKIFERLYRVDPSRNRLTGAAGLGLSICESIIRCHKGEIKARESMLGGVAIEILLPILALENKQ